MLGALRDHVVRANKELARRDLARFTFGNASAIDRANGLVVIKPSGIPYDQPTVEGTMRPSSDLATHLALYRAFPEIGGVVHTHSHFATVWAQAGRAIPCLGTTHADHFHGPVPVTDAMGAATIESEYEANTGAAIIATFADIDPRAVPAVLVRSHAPFCWGRTVEEAVETASVLEEVARMAYHTVTLNAGAGAIPAVLHDRHFLRKHGGTAYYGQA
jgi:L-ribulose-5-phosphate 4-epimerase